MPALSWVFIDRYQISVFGSAAWMACTNSRNSAATASAFCRRRCRCHRRKGRSRGERRELRCDPSRGSRASGGHHRSLGARRAAAPCPRPAWPIAGCSNRRRKGCRRVPVAPHDRLRRKPRCPQRRNQACRRRCAALVDEPANQTDDAEHDDCEQREDDPFHCKALGYGALLDLDNIHVVFVYNTYILATMRKERVPSSLPAPEGKRARTRRLLIEDGRATDPRRGLFRRSRWSR